MARPSTTSLFPPYLRLAAAHPVEPPASLTPSFTPSGLLHPLAAPALSRCSSAPQASALSPQSPLLLSLSSLGHPSQVCGFNKSALPTGLQIHPPAWPQLPITWMSDLYPKQVCQFLSPCPLPPHAFPRNIATSYPWFFKSETWEPSFFPSGSSSDSSAVLSILPASLQSLFISLQLFCPPLSPGTTVSSLGGYNSLQLSAYLLSAPPTGSRHTLCNKSIDSFKITN